MTNNYRTEILCNITKENILSKTFVKAMAGKLVQGLFKESSGKRNLMRFAC